MSVFSYAVSARWRHVRSRGQALFQQALTSDFVRKVAETFGTRVLVIGIGLATGVIVTRTLGPDGRGQYAAAVTLGAIGAQFGNLGLHASNTYYVARDRSLLPALMGNSLVVSFGLGGLGVSLTWLIFAQWPALAPVEGRLLALALLWVPFALANLLVQNLLLGIQAVRTYNLVELLPRLLAAALIVTAILVRAVSPTVIFSISFATLVIGFLWMGWKLYCLLPSPLAWSQSLFRKGLQYGFKAYIAAFFAFIVLRVDLLMINYILGAEQTGYYSVAANMVDMVYILPVVIGSLLFPRLSAMADNAQRWRYARRMLLVVAITIIILGAGAMLVAKPVILLLYGADFLPALPAFLWLVPAIVLLSINIVYMNYFASVGMPLVTVYSPLFAAVLNILLNTQLIPAYGIQGASISSLVAYGFMLGVSVVYQSRQKA